MTRVPQLRGVIVLTYHGALARPRDDRLDRNLIEIEALGAQLAIIRRHRVISMPELEDMLTRQDVSPAIAITIDDGLEGTQPLAEALERARLPWTLFVSTGPVSRGGTIWTAELALLVLHGEARTLEVLGRRWELGSRPTRENAFQDIRTALKSRPSMERRLAMDRIRAAFPAGETERLLARFPEYRALTWDAVRALRMRGATIGSHGVEHELHHANQPSAERVRELVDSRATIERETGARCRYFSYPNGDSVPESSEEVRRAGYALALSTRAASVTASSVPTAIPRVEAGGSGAALLRHIGRADSSHSPS